jgi:hypothetical protein
MEERRKSKDRLKENNSSNEIDVTEVVDEELNRLFEEKLNEFGVAKHIISNQLKKSNKYKEELIKGFNESLKKEQENPPAELIQNNGVQNLQTIYALLKNGSIKWSEDFLNVNGIEFLLNNLMNIKE